MTSSSSSIQFQLKSPKHKINWSNAKNLVSLCEPVGQFISSSSQISHKSAWAALITDKEVNTVKYLIQTLQFSNPFCSQYLLSEKESVDTQYLDICTQIKELLTFICLANNGK